MISSINQAIAFLQSNQIPSDEISVIGFDGSAGIDIRTLGPFSIDVASTDPQGNSFQELIDLSNLDAADPNHPRHLQYKQSRFADHMFFPRVTTDTLDLTKNIPEALHRAQEILTSEGIETSHSMVVLISDGITNCFEDPTVSGASTDNPKRVCSNSYPGFLNSMDQIRTIIENEYIPNNIKFNFIQIGQRAAPHILQRVNDSNADGTLDSCLTEDDAKREDPPLAMQDNTFDVTPPNTPESEFSKITYGEIKFTPATGITEFTEMTGGKYLPIRECCSQAPNGTCTDVTQEIQDECTASTANHGDPIQGSYSDARGRITCNPTQDTPRQQMQNAIREVFNIDPYLIVD